LSSVLAFPASTFAVTADAMAGKLKDAALKVGIPLIVVGWVVAGILYLTSAGGSQMEVGKKALIACVVGTVLVILAAGAEQFIRTLFGL
jgi:hypothetical protein